MAQLGTGVDSLKAAIGMVTAEKNFNNNRGSGLPAVCGEPSLPQTPQLRGITPLIDPEVLNAQVANQLSARTEAAPIDARGQSIADLMVANGFTEFVREALDGTTTSSQGQPQIPSNNPNVNPNAGQGAGAAGVGTNNPSPGVGGAGAGGSSSGSTTGTTSAGVGSSGAGAATGSGSISDPLVISPQFAGQRQTARAANTDATFQTSSIIGLDFGNCTPTMKFEGGMDGRSDNEGAFQAIDPRIATGQQSSRDPKTITDRICSQVSSAACGANDAAKDACESTKAQIAAQNDNDKSTADAWNAALGFAGIKTNAVVGRETLRHHQRRFVA